MPNTRSCVSLTNGEKMPLFQPLTRLLFPLSDYLSTAATVRIRYCHVVRVAIINQVARRIETLFPWLPELGRVHAAS